MYINIYPIHIQSIYFIFFLSLGVCVCVCVLKTYDLRKNIRHVSKEFLVDIIEVYHLTLSKFTLCSYYELSIYKKMRM